MKNVVEDPLLKNARTEGKSRIQKMKIIIYENECELILDS